jgi:pimeloyl-ACP methyl ester carboxylesterase
VIEPFRIDIPQADLDDLADRLARTRWPDELPDAGDVYGLPLRRMRDLVEHWRTAYDWRKHEARLNELPQYTTEIDGQRVHFVHVRSADPGALPLILTHGWPGSFLEFIPMIERLAGTFHLVIPSIPGFGFSGPTHERGWGVERVAKTWATLMNRLGYDRYGAQGGDWGSVISRELARIAPDHVVGVHLNYLPTPPIPGLELSGQDEIRMGKIRALLAERPAFQTLMATTPQSIAYGLHDSPTALLAWIGERFDEWADPASKLSDDDLLTNVSLYWLTGTANSASRLRKESTNPARTCDVPIGVAVLPQDITQAVRPIVEQTYQVIQWTEFDRGGHFAALEVPDLLAADITNFFNLLASEEPRAIAHGSSDATDQV